MLTITVAGEESWDEEKEIFVYPDSFEIQLEHSLVSLSKWEATWEKPFLLPGDKTYEEALGYVKAMILTPNVTEETLNKLSEANYEEINDYIGAKMTATWFNEPKNRPASRSSETITSELIYYWMLTFNIPMECERWHLNRLFTLIKICNLKQEKPKKMSQQENAQSMAEINAKRKAQLGTRG